MKSVHRLRQNVVGSKNRLRRLTPDHHVPSVKWPSSTVGPSTIDELAGRFGFGKSALARMLGATPQMVSKWSNGSAEPSGPAKRLIEFIHDGNLSVDHKKYIRKRGRKKKEERT